MSSAPGDPRNTAAWRRLRRLVLDEEPYCKLSLIGCTLVSTTADHIITVKERPDLALIRSNVQGACQGCNYRRNKRAIDEIDHLRISDLPPALAWFQ